MPFRSQLLSGSFLTEPQAVIGLSDHAMALDGSQMQLSRGHFPAAPAPYKDPCFSEAFLFFPETPEDVLTIFAGLNNGDHKDINIQCLAKSIVLK